VGGLRKPTKKVRIAGISVRFEPFMFRITFLAATYVRKQYKGNAFLRFHGKRDYAKAPHCYVIVHCQPDLFRNSVNKKYISIYS
jgi:hypothetical protein